MRWSPACTHRVDGLPLPILRRYGPGGARAPPGSGSVHAVLRGPSRLTTSRQDAISPAPRAGIVGWPRCPPPANSTRSSLRMSAPHRRHPPRQRTRTHLPDPGGGVRLPRRCSPSTPSPPVRVHLHVWATNDAASRHTTSPSVPRADRRACASSSARTPRRGPGPAFTGAADVSVTTQRHARPHPARPLPTSSCPDGTSPWMWNRSARGFAPSANASAAPVALAEGFWRSGWRTGRTR
jgi:hypothetical protein